MRIDNAGKSKGRVPNDFPEMKCVSRIGSESNKCYRPFYSAKDVWTWFKTHGDI